MYFLNFELLCFSRMFSKRLKILHVYEKMLQNSFDLKTGAISNTCPEQNISDFDYGGDNLSHPCSHVFGKIFVATSVFSI